MNLMNGRGQVLRRTLHREEDVRTVLFVREIGKLTVLSKGSRRLTSKIRVLQEPFSEVDVQLFVPSHGIHARLISGRLLNSHPRLRHNLASFEIAARSCEVVDLLLPYRAAAPEVYDILSRCLSALETSAWPSLEWIDFVVNLIRCLGHGDFRPEVARFLAASSDVRIRRCLAFLDLELNRLLPRPLKSTVLAGL